MRFNKWDSEMKMTDEIKTPMTAEEQEAIHKLISSIEPLPPLGEPHKEVWLVQAWDESDEDPTPLFSFAFTDKDEAKKVRDAGVKVSSGAGMWTIDRVVLDAAEDAMRVIEEMVAINKQSDYDMEYYDKEIL